MAKNPVGHGLLPTLFLLCPPSVFIQLSEDSEHRFPILWRQPGHQERTVVGHRIGIGKGKTTGRRGLVERVAPKGLGNHLDEVPGMMKPLKPFGRRPDIVQNRSDFFQLGTK